MNEILFGLKHNKSLTSMNYAIPGCVRRVEFDDYMNFVESDRQKLHCFCKIIYFLLIQSFLRHSIRMRIPIYSV